MATQTANVAQLQRRANDIHVLKEKNAVRIEQMWEKERERDRGELRARTRTTRTSSEGVGYDSNDDDDSRQTLPITTTTTTTTKTGTNNKNRGIEQSVKKKNNNNDNESLQQSKQHLETTLEYLDPSNSFTTTTSSSSQKNINIDDEDNDDNTSGNNDNITEKSDTYMTMKTSKSSGISGDNTIISSESLAQEDYSSHNESSMAPSPVVKMVVKRKKKVRRAEIGDS